MAFDSSSASPDHQEEADLVKAFQELAKGERTATMLENQLSRMEARIEELLAQAEKEEQEVQEIKKNKVTSAQDETINTDGDSAQIE